MRQDEAESEYGVRELTRNDDLENWTSVTSQEMDLVYNDEADLTHVATGLPATGNAIPLFRCRDNHIGILDCPGVRCVVAYLELGLQPPRSGLDGGREGLTS